MLPLLGLALGLQLPCVRNGPSQLSGATSPGVIGRRELGALAGMAVLTLANRECSAYDSIPTIDPNFGDLEQKRRDQAKEISANKAMLKPYLDKFIGAFDEKSFEAASDNLAVWIINQGKLPTGIDPRSVRDVIQTTYESMPTFSYKCKTTRNGICYTKGPAVETAYTGVINELRRSASRASGKGALISDGISAANSAAF
jgi:hypothetical protein